MNKVVKTIFFFILTLSGLLFSQQNQITIRSDRVFVLNGKPFFPIGICFENQPLYYQLRNNGFNFINLFSQNHFLYSDSCGFNSRNTISGDATTSEQYRQLLENYAQNLRWDENAHRIFNYIGSDNFYILADDYTFYPDDINDYILNTGSCGDSIIFSQNFNQVVRNESVNRIIDISNWQGNKLIGTYAKDDANLFQVDGPYPTYYYDNYFNVRVKNYTDTYTEFKKSYPNSVVLMSIPNTYFPRAVDYQHWQNTDTAREHWISDAKKLFQGADVLFCPGYMTYEFYSDEFMIYNNKFPSIYTYDLDKTVFGRIITPGKAVFGGLIFDIAGSVPDSTDPRALDKIKWHIYAGLEKGCTGLIFFGWQKYARPDGGFAIIAWNHVRTVINEMTNILHLDKTVFINTNSGQTGHSISGSTSGNVSYAVYKVSGWNDYYLLVTNNPNGSLFANEPDNDVIVRANASGINWRTSRIKEVFSGREINIQPDLSIHYHMKSYETLLLHISPGEVPVDFHLYQNFPNPFNPVTTIKFDIPSDLYVTLKVYDITGREIAVPVNGLIQAGSYAVEWNGKEFSSGTYFYSLHAGNYEDSKKMVLLK